jgi:hypothetical protein
MGILVSDINLRLDDLLKDESSKRWTDAERLRWINDAPGAILSRKPSALSRRTILTLVAGTYQALPTDSVLLLDVVRNMGASGTTAGKIIRRTDRQQLDDIDDGWHTATASEIIAQFTFDDRLPKAFYCYPPAVAGTKVEILDSYLPAKVTSMSDTLDVSPEYMDPIVNYVVYRANSKDDEYSNAAIAGAYLQAFDAMIGTKTQADAQHSPNQPGNSV